MAFGQEVPSRPKLKPRKLHVLLKNHKMPKATQKTISDKKKETPGNKVKCKKKLKSDGIQPNPWLYAETVPLLPETGKIDIKGLESLECRQQYQISLVKLENETSTLSEKGDHS